MAQASLHTSAQIFARYRVLDSPTEPQRCSGPLGKSSDQTRDEFLKASRMPEAVTRFLAELDRKVDMLLAYMEKDTLESYFTYEGFLVALSPGSCILECKEPLAPGDWLEIILYLTEFPLQIASGVGQVEAVLQKAPATLSQFTVYSVRFEALREDDKERIIGFIFSEERKRIREQKNNGW